MKLVSIIIPIYNMGSTINNCVRTILQQTYQSIEVILVDDGSTDNSYQQCLSLATIDERITVLHTDNQGSGPARNEGIDVAQGEYMYFPDADDVIAPDAIATLVNTIEKSNADLVVFGYRQVTQSGHLLKEKKYTNSIQDGETIRQDYTNYISTETLYSIQGAPWNKFFKSSIVKTYKVKFPPLRRHQDECFISKYMCHVKTVQFIDSVLYTYTVNGLGVEWRKYPVNYIDSVNSLYYNRKETILSWNANNTSVRDKVYQEYICMFSKAMELSFAPKMKLKNKTRYKWIKEQVRASYLYDMYPPSSLRVYHKVLYILFTNNHILSAMLCLRFKILIQQIITLFK